MRPGRQHPAAGFSQALVPNTPAVCRVTALPGIGCVDAKNSRARKWLSVGLRKRDQVYPEDPFDAGGSGNQDDV
jgi:hypothetical protein